MRRVYERILGIRGQLITLAADGVALGELALISAKGKTLYASVLRIDGKLATLQVFGDTRGLSTHSQVSFLGRELMATCGQGLLGRQLNALGQPIDHGPKILGRELILNAPPYNPIRRRLPSELIRTNIPMIDVFNCLVKSQKIPIFSVAGEPYNALLMRIASQTDADVVIIGGIALRFDDYQMFVDKSQELSGKALLFIHQAIDPPVQGLLIPDMALACAEHFATAGSDVLVLLTDMSAFANALKEIMVDMDQIPATRGYPGSLYSELAARYEKAVDIDGGGSVTIISVTTMPGGDLTHPIPDNTGYITEGQFYLMGGKIDSFGSLSRLKQQVIGKGTREDHQELANCQIRLYAEAEKARERAAMGFHLSRWDGQLLRFASLFEEELMGLDINLTLEKALDTGWHILSKSFARDEVGIRQSLLSKYWPDEN